jgi:hypothetical protein
MGMIVKYVCPIYKNVVLFTEDLGTSKYFVMERPQTCPKCKKPYYKSECEQEYGSGGSSNEDEG